MTKIFSPLSVAPMMDWTDRHCRYFHRLINRDALLYSEMVTTGALIHGDVQQHLNFNPPEHPVALQLGGSDPLDLAKCAKLGEQWGYDEINLNCGCPSPRVQRGAFGACLMRESALVADCIKAMQDAVSTPITVKHRIGVDRCESYDFVRDFVGEISRIGCQTFIVHARNAWLDGLSPKENRTTPPLRYEMVYQLKKDFPALTIIINGGIKTSADITQHLKHVDGVMVGREAYHHPYSMSDWDHLFNGNGTASPPHIATKTRAEIEAQMVQYMVQQAQQGVAWYSIARHMLGLYHGMPGARRWRQVWSDHRLKREPALTVAHLAWKAREGFGDLGD